MNTTLLSFNKPTRIDRLLKSVFTVALVVLFCNVSRAQLVADNYSFSEVTGATYTPITGGNVVASGVYGAGNFQPSATPGFNILFNNASYNTVYVSDNGFITFGVAPVAGAIAPISTTTASMTGVISAFAANLGGAVASSEIRYETINSAPNRVFVVQYKDIQRRNAFGALIGLMNFQIRYYEATGVIEVIFQNAFTSSSATSISGQVGLRGLNFGDFNNRKTAVTTWPPTIPGTVNTDGLPTSNTVTYQAGTKFTWTPCFSPSSTTAVMQANNSTVDISWTGGAIAPTGGYDYEIRTSGAPGSGATGLFASGNTSSTSVSVPGLSIGITYYIYVKSTCKNIWVPAAAPSSVSVTPTCAIATIPYLQNFEGITAPAIPNCNSVQVVSGSAMVTRNNSSSAYYGFNSKNLATSGALAMDTWYFTQGINFPTAGTYKVSYIYGGSRELPQFVQKMDVAIGSVNSAAGMAAGTTLAQYTNIKNSPVNGAVNFTVVTPGTYYIGFRGYAAATNGVLQVDDIRVDYSTCFSPTALAAGQVASQSAIISWTAPASAPSGGYEYYLSPSSTAPSVTTLPTGTTVAGATIASLNGLASSTTYYFWVRSGCGGGDFSQWSAVGTFTTTAQLTYCTPADNGTKDPNGITNVLIGSINNTTGLETASYGDYSSLVTNIAQATTVPVGITYGTGFTYETQIWVDWNDDGDFNDDQEAVYSGVSTNANPTTLNATFVVPTTVTNGAVTTNTLGPHRMRIGGIDGPAFAGGALTPCRTGAYQVFEDYTVYVITPPPALTLNEYSNMVCSGDSTPFVTITSNHSDFQVYTWSPSGGVSGSLATGYTFNPTSTTTYVLTAQQTSGSYSSNTVSYSLRVNPLPTPITITPAAVARCQSEAPTALVSSGGIVSGVSIMSENFNSGTGSWTTINASTGGTVANAAWTIRNTGYNPGGSSGISSVVSNDASQFYISNSDAQGSGSQTDVTLLSPTFSLVGYTSASMEFYHYYKPWINGSATVEIFKPGTGWITLQTWGTSATTSAQGTPTNFKYVVYDLTPYIGISGLQVRFKYFSSWGYVWAIDNVLVSGSAASAITWSPLAGLFTDAAGTTAYTGSGAATVYADPASTTTYSAYAETPDGCGITSDVTVSVTPIAAGSASSDQTVCTGVVSDLVLTGTSGTITGWQYASDLAFTVGVTNIPSSASATLTSALIGTLSATRYFRAVVTNGTCTDYSNVITVTVNATTWTGAWSNGTPSATKAAIFASNFTSTGNMNSCSVTVNAGANVVFQAGHTLIAQNGVTVNGSLTFNNTASLVQSNNAAVNTGNIVYKRDTQMKRFDYTYWSSPVSPQTLASFSPNTLADKYFWWNPAIYNWETIAAPGITNMVPARGYIIRAPEGWATTLTTWNGVFTGVPNNGIITIPVQVSGANDLNLLGNPYPSAINANTLLSTTGPNAGILGGTLYFWTHNTPINPYNYVQSDYAVYNLVGGVGTGTPAGGTGNTSTPTGRIGAGQGFFVKGLSSGDATFDNTMRITGNNTQFFRTDESVASPSTELEKHRLWLDIKNTAGAYKQMLVGYIETATSAKDISFDGDLVDVGNAVTLYSVLEQDKLSIQGRPLPFSADDIVPLGYRASVAGDFEILLSDFDGLFTTQNIYLEDKLLNVIQDLKSGSYIFATGQGEFNDRFVLRYTDGTSLGLNTQTVVSAVVIKSNNAISIKTGALIDKVEIFDVTGRLIVSKTDVNSQETQFQELSVAQEVLLVKITFQTGATATKKVVY
jgi:hypothetical protein